MRARACAPGAQVFHAVVAVLVAHGCLTVFALLHADAGAASGCISSSTPDAFSSQHLMHLV